MTHSEAVQHIKRLKRISALETTDTYTWLALLDDELASSIPNSKLLERFQKVKLDGERELGETPVPESQVQSMQQIRGRCRDLIQAACERLESEPIPKEDLSEEVDRAIQKGYFKSIYFRTVLGGLALVLTLVTGIEGYKLSEQLKAMQKIVDEARQQVEQSRVEVAKSATENQANEGKLALLLLEGDQRMVEMRTKALTQMDEEGFADRMKIAERAKHWTDEDQNAKTAQQNIDDIGADGKKRITNETVQAGKGFDDSVAKNKSALENELTSTLQRLQTQKTPWIPRVMWSFSKSWILGPLAAIAAVMALLTSLSTLAASGANWTKNSRWVKGVAIMNSALLVGLGTAFIVFWYRG